MENIKILYIDDSPDTALSRYLDSYSQDDCNFESSDIKFNPEEGYESLISNTDVELVN